MTYFLFIDDERDPIDVTWGSADDQDMYREAGWVIARNWHEALEIIVSLGFPSLISFDHDLGENEITGFDITKKLVEMIMDGVELPKNFEFRVHSKNPIGAENIRSYWMNFLETR